MRPKQDSVNIGKVLVLLALLSLTFLSTSAILQMYPQHIYLNEKTLINSNVGNFTNNTVQIKGNQVQYNQGDLITIEGRDYIRITGREIQLGESEYIPGIRQVTASLYQNILFEQRIGTFSINKISQIIINTEVINIIPLSPTAVNIKTLDSNYIIEFTQNITYFTTNNGTMIKLQRNNNDIIVYIIGLKNYDRIIMKVI